MMRGPRLKSCGSKTMMRGPRLKSCGSKTMMRGPRLKSCGSKTMMRGPRLKLSVEGTEKNKDLKLNFTVLSIPQRIL